MSESILDSLAQEVATTGEFNRVTKLPGIIPPGATVDSLLSAVKAIKLILDAREGVSGSVLDKNLTMRDLLDAGALQIKIGNTTLGGLLGSGVTFPAVSSAPGYTDPRPILAAPPTLTALTATGTLRTVFLKWSMVVYRNHSYVEVWRATSNSLGLASQIGVSLSTLYVDEGVAASVTYWYWVRAIGFDTSGAPIVGAFNGVSGTAGGAQMIGNVDLGPLIIQAANIAANAVDTSKMTVSDFSTIADNPTFEAGDVGWGKEGSWAIVNSPANAFNGNWCATTSGTFPQALRNQIKIPVVVGDEFYAEALIKTVGVTGTGSAVRLTGYSASGAEVFQPNANFITGTSAYSKSSISVTIPAGVATIDVELLSLNTGGTVYADNVRFQRKLTLNHLAAGSIAVGTAAIQNAAIVNAMIANLAVDNAKIANLDGAKITADSITAAQIAANAITTSELAANAVTAGKIAANTITAGQIAANTITSAQILAGSITADRISASTLSAITANLGVINAGDISGVSIHGGSHTGAFAWPATGAGFTLRTEGLLLGNYNLGQYVQINADGTLVMPGFSSSGGNATFSGNLSAATGTFAGTLTAGALIVAGQSIFSPAAAEAFATVSASGTWTQVLGPTAYVYPGGTGVVQIVICCDWYTGWSTTGGETDFTSYSPPGFRLKRNGTVINSWTPRAGSLAQTMSVTFLDSPGSSATYALEILGATGLVSNPSVSHRTMTAIGVVR